MRKCKSCDNQARKGGTECQKCYVRRWRKENPIKNCWMGLKSSAKKRGIPFHLTFEEFKEHAVEQELMKKKGESPKRTWSVDRIKETWEEGGELGYHVDNIQIMKTGKNSSKYQNKKAQRLLKAQWDGGQMQFYYPKPPKEINPEEYPF